MADPVNNRTYDPDTGLELNFNSGGSDGSQSLEIRGDGYILSFKASQVAEPITAAELQQFDVADAGVWRVYGSWTPSQQLTIIAALSATKMGHGFSPRGAPYFVRFEPKGALRSG
jgi:hypothetical protein